MATLALDCRLDTSADESISLVFALIHVGRRIAIPLVLLLPQARAQSQGSDRGNDPAILQIRLIEGEGAVYHIGARATRGVTVQVTDETGKPVDGARVSFRLPESGPGGVFSTGARTEIATTRSDGRAGVWGMQWNRTPGPFEIRVTAEKGQTRAGIICTQYLTDSPETASQTARIGPGRSHKWLWIVAGVAGAAAAGVAATASRDKPPGTAPAQGVTIGAPTITLGRP